MAKTVCVSYGRMFHALYGTPIVICRILMAYGPEQKSRKIVPYIIRSMLAGEAPKLASASRLLDWIYVDDAIDALVLAGSQPGIEGETFEIGSGKTLSIGDLAEQVRRMIPGAPQPSVIDHKPSGRGRCADLAQAAARLGWTPMVSLEEGLARTIEWYRSADRRSGTDIQETPKPMADQLAGDKSQ
jgi:nucleoside-diphosphate-sugar epimerase